MADILGNKRNGAPEPGDGRGYVGTRYEVTPLPSTEVITAHVARIRQEMGIKQVGQMAIGKSRRVEAPTYKDLERAKTTKPGWWF